jgi:hypothetical protein
VKLPQQRHVPHVVAVAGPAPPAHPTLRQPGTATTSHEPQASGTAALFRAPRHSRGAAPLRAALTGTRLQQRRPARRAARGNAGDAFGFDLDDENDAAPNTDAQTTMTLDTSLGGGEGQGGDREGSQQERRFTFMARSRRGDLAAAGSRAPDELLSDVRAARSLDELAQALRPALTPGRTGLAGVLVSVARAWQASRVEGAAREPTTLAGVRQALVHAGAGVAPAGDTALNERQAAVNLWLPIYLLNLDRPRSAQQRQQALERLAFIERGLPGRTPVKG